ncbi:hypothetical protein OEZ86_006480 [Tetradesmus obliquus]|nr:hypothetical protein OEZ86_006480 [Tetradesmus obliquus]
MDSTLTYQQRNTVQHQTQRGPQGLGTSLNPKPGTSRGRAQLRRQWTLCKHKPGPGGSSSSSTVMAALPLPFMELSVSVMDTLDLLRSSVEEEIVFQATLQVPAHHAIACRIDAYNTPFANAPALYANPQQLTEDDKQFAACLASPPDLEEAPHSFTFSRPTFEQRAGSGLLTMTLSMRQRQGSQKQQQDDDAAEDDTAVAPDLRSRSILRLESFGLDGRRQLQEVPVAAAPGANALACLMGFGYMVLHTWQARTEPATRLLGKHVEALAGTGHLKNRLVV